MIKKIMLKNECWCGSGKKYSECHGRYDEAIEKAKRERHPVSPQGNTQNP